jgi:hypothetical protein
MHDFEDVLSGQYTFDYQNRLCVLEEKEGQDRIYASISHNLDTHTLLIALLETLKDLSLEYGDAVIYTLKVCLDFLVNLIKVDKKLQVKEQINIGQQCNSFPF